MPQAKVCILKMIWSYQCYECSRQNQLLPRRGRRTLRFRVHMEYLCSVDPREGILALERQHIKATAYDRTAQRLLRTGNNVKFVI